MASYTSVSAVGKSLERLLNAAFKQEEPVPGKRTGAHLIRTEDFDKTTIGGTLQLPVLSIFLYRVDFNKTMRAAWSAVGNIDGRAHLPVDLHYLLTAWADNAEHEHRVIGRTIQCLETTPILSGPLLFPADWMPNESIQVVLEDIPTDALMRTFDSLPIDYKLSIPYIARVVRIDATRAQPEPPVVTAVTGLTTERST